VPELWACCEKSTAALQRNALPQVWRAYEASGRVTAMSKKIFGIPILWTNRNCTIGLVRNTKKIKEITDQSLSIDRHTYIKVPEDEIYSNKRYILWRKCHYSVDYVHHAKKVMDALEESWDIYMPAKDALPMLIYGEEFSVFIAAAEFMDSMPMVLDQEGKK